MDRLVTLRESLLVRTAVRFGFSLEQQMAGFLRALDAGSAPCRRVREAATETVPRLP